MRANRREPVSVPFWFQSKKCRPHGGLLQVSQQLETGAMRGLINCSRQFIVLERAPRYLFVHLRGPVAPAYVRSGVGSGSCFVSWKPLPEPALSSQPSINSAYNKANDFFRLAL